MTAKSESELDKATRRGDAVSASSRSGNAVKLALDAQVQRLLVLMAY